MSPRLRPLTVYLLVLFLALLPLRTAQAVADGGESATAASQMDGPHQTHCGTTANGGDGGDCPTSGCDACAACFAALPAGFTLAPAAAPPASRPPLSSGLAHHPAHPPFRPPRG